MEMTEQYNENKEKLIQILEEIEKHGNYIRVASNTLASIYHEQVDTETINSIDRYTHFLDTIARKFSEEMKSKIKQLDIYSNSIGVSKELSKQTIANLINNMMSESEERLITLMEVANTAQESIKEYGKLDLEESSGFYEETIQGLKDIQDKALDVDELFMELCNPVSDKLYEEVKEPEESPGDIVLKETEEWFKEEKAKGEEPKDKYWVLESFGDVIDYYYEELKNVVIPLAVFKSKPTFEKLSIFLFGQITKHSTDVNDINHLIENGNVSGEIGREIHLNYAQYRLIECEYD